MMICLFSMAVGEDSSHNIPNWVVWERRREAQRLWKTINDPNSENKAERKRGESHNRDSPADDPILSIDGYHSSRSNR